MKKINTESLYVGCKVAEVEELIEPFEQYETVGDILHKIVVNQERILVYLEDDKNCVDAITGRKFKISNFERSFHTEATAVSSTRLAYINGGYSLPINSMRESFERETIEKLNQVGYITNFRQYINERLNVDVEEVTLNQARILLFFANMKKRKTIILSEDSEEAKFQIEEITGVNSSTRKR